MPNLIASSATISKLVDFEESIRGNKIQIGDKSFVDSFVKMKFSGGKGDIIIGEKCYINSGCVFYSGHGIVLGNKVLIASNCTLAPVNHGIKKESTMLEQPHMASKGGIIIEDDVWIGANTVILDGSYIETGCIVGAGSVVRGRLLAYGIYVGNPIHCQGQRE
jgi:virginiamycin A acetyltransferase